MRHRQIYDAGRPASSVAVYDALGQMQIDVLTSVMDQNNNQQPANDPIGAFAQWGAFTDEQTKGTASTNSQPGSVGSLTLSSGRYYDTFEGRYLSRDEMKPAPYIGGDDGSATLALFEYASYIPIVGAPFALAMGIEDIKEGNWLSGGLNIVAGVLPVAVEGVGVIKAAKAATSAMAETASHGSIPTAQLIQRIANDVEKWVFRRESAEQAQAQSRALGNTIAPPKYLSGTNDSMAIGACVQRLPI